MSIVSRLVVIVLAVNALASCATQEVSARSVTRDAAYIPAEHGTASLRSLVAHHAAQNDVPVDLVHRVVMRESRYNPAARNGPYWGLMQIHPQTARTMGFRGDPAQLLDPDTNLRYAVRYLRGAWLVADGDPDRAVMWYARGYYYEARDRGMLEVTGLR